MRFSVKFLDVLETLAQFETQAALQNYVNLWWNYYRVSPCSKNILLALCGKHAASQDALMARTLSFHLANHPEAKQTCSSQTATQPCMSKGLQTGKLSNFSVTPRTCVVCTDL